MTTVQLTSISAVILSLLFSYLPGLSTWYEKLTSEAKRLIMLALLLIIVTFIYLAACTGYIALLGLTLTCDQPTAFALIQTFIMTLVANQSTYLITPRSKT